MFGNKTFFSSIYNVIFGCYVEVSRLHIDLQLLII